MKMRKFAGFMLAGTMLLSTLSGCGSTIVDQAGSAGAESVASSEQTQSTEDKTDLTEKVSPSKSTMRAWQQVPYHHLQPGIP